MPKILPLTLALMATTTLFAGAKLVAQQPAADTSITRAAAQTRAAEAFALLDTNDDGQLTPADRAAEARARFDAADADNNGQLSFDEVTAAREARREDRGEGFAMGGPQRGPEHGRMREAMHARADTDASGTVSQSEFTAAALARFDRADANDDGTISADERQDLRGANGREGRGGHWRQRG